MIGTWRVAETMTIIVEGTGISQTIGLGMLVGKESGVAVGAGPTVGAMEDVGLVELPALKGLEIFENFQMMVQARGATHTPLAGRSPHTVVESSR
jgi:hypothetical protein